MYAELSQNLAPGRAGVSRFPAGSGATILAFPQRNRSDKKPMNESAASTATIDNQEMAGWVAAIADDRDRGAFKDLYSYFAPRLKSFLRGRGVVDAAADDLLQVIMLSVWEKAHLYDSAKANVNTWIFTIARYKYIDSMRRSGRQPVDSEEDLDIHPAETQVTDEEVLGQQRQAAVRAAIATLPEDQQTVIFLSFIKGLAHSEIAEQLGLPLGTVKSRIRRAFERLRNELGDIT